MNRHPVDALADVRAQIKALTELEASLKTQVSALMGQTDCVEGDQYVATLAVSERKGGICEKALKLAGIDPDRFRKDAVTVFSLKLGLRVAQAA